MRIFESKEIFTEVILIKESISADIPTMSKFTLLADWGEISPLAEIPSLNVSKYISSIKLSYISISNKININNLQESEQRVPLAMHLALPKQFP